MRAWLRSNPIGYANWFHEVMREEWDERRAALVEKVMSVAEVPDWTVKTTLQRAVQALKRHRDIYFKDSLDDRPASVIITTLAARAYRRQGTLFEVLVDVSETMPSLVDSLDHSYVVSNPVQPEENFADRWREHPDRAKRFFDWIQQAHADFVGLGEDRGIDRVLESLK